MVGYFHFTWIVPCPVLDLLIRRPPVDLYFIFPGEKDDRNRRSDPVLGCPSGWTRNGQRCYLHVSAPNTWVGAEVTIGYQVNKAVCAFLSQIPDYRVWSLDVPVKAPTCSSFFVTLQQRCLAWGANLASVHSFSEYVFLQKLVSSNSHPVTWIGGTDAYEVSIGFMYVL